MTRSTPSDEFEKLQVAINAEQSKVVAVKSYADVQLDHGRSQRVDEDCRKLVLVLRTCFLKHSYTQVQSVLISQPSGVVSISQSDVTCGPGDPADPTR